MIFATAVKIDHIRNSCDKYGLLMIIIQVDEATSIAGDSHLIVYVGYVAETNIIKDMHIILQSHSWKGHIQ